MSWAIKEQEKAKYDQIFDGLLPVNGLLSGDKVKPILLNSKLPIPVLGSVWELSDIDKDGMLDRDEFSIAMHLVYKSLERNPLPLTLPLELVPLSKRNIPLPSLQPIINKIVITAAEKTQYDSLFAQYDTDDDGLVGGGDVKELFINTGLPQHVLAHIWNLSDLTATGKLNKDQFHLAMSLVQMKLQGHQLPPTITADMLPTSIQLPIPDSMGLVTGGFDDSNNKELQLIVGEINALKNEKMALEREVAQNEADIKLEEREMANVQKEFEDLQLNQKQLESKKVEAQQRSDELDEKKKKLQTSVIECKSQVEKDQFKIQELRHTLNNSKPMSQEEEMAKLRDEIAQLAAEGTDVEARYIEAINTEKRLNERIKHLEGLITQPTLDTDAWETEQTKDSNLFASEDPFNNFDPFPKSQNDPFGGDSLAEHFKEDFDEALNLKEFSTEQQKDPWGESNTESLKDDFAAFGFSEASQKENLPDDNFDPFGQGSFQNDFTDSSGVPVLPPKQIKSPAPPRPPAPKPNESSLSAANVTAVKLIQHKKNNKIEYISEAEQLAKAKRDSEEEYERMKRMKEKEDEELQMAIALSKQEMGGN